MVSCMYVYTHYIYTDGYAETRSLFRYIHTHTGSFRSVVLYKQISIFFPLKLNFLPTKSTGNPAPW